MSHISSTWILEIINFLQTHQIRLIIHNLLSFTLQRTNDKHIMDDIIQTRLKIKQLKQINACRMFLNIIHLSDMYHPNGVNIYDQSLSGEKRQFPRSTMSWPIQMNPSKSSWKLWNKTIKTTFGIQNDNKLFPHLTLGKWILPH